MRRLSNERLLYMVLSVLVATVAWLYVATAQNPLVERGMTVELHVKGLGSDEVLVQPPPNHVQVRLQGPRSALASLSPAALDASIDLSGLRPGEHRVPVVVATPADVRPVTTTPSEVLVVLDTLARERLPVEVSLIGTPPQGVTVGLPRVTPQHVIVSGAASVVEEVRHAVVTVDTSGLRQQLVTSAPVRLVDANGQEVRGLSVSPPIVEATLPVREGVITKVVPIVPTIVGAPPAPLAVTAVTVSPPTATLTAPETSLVNVQAVPTAPVDLSSARTSLTVAVPLQLPAGVTSSVARATVSVWIGRTLVSTIVRHIPVHVVGAPPGRVIRVVPDAVDVQVEGPQDVVVHLTAQAVRVEVSAAGRAAGQYELVPRALLPSGVRVLAITPARVLVVLAPS